jgi:hypothetical protein
MLVAELVGHLTTGDAVLVEPGRGGLAEGVPHRPLEPSSIQQGRANTTTSHSFGTALTFRSSRRDTSHAGTTTVRSLSFVLPYACSTRPLPDT